MKQWLKALEGDDTPAAIAAAEALGNLGFEGQPAAPGLALMLRHADRQRRLAAATRAGTSGACRRRFHPHARSGRQGGRRRGPCRGGQGPGAARPSRSSDARITRSNCRMSIDSRAALRPLNPTSSTMPTSQVSSRCVGRRLAIVHSPLRDRRDLPPRRGDGLPAAGGAPGRIAGTSRRRLRQLRGGPGLRSRPERPRSPGFSAARGSGCFPPWKRSAAAGPSSAAVAAGSGVKRLAAFGHRRRVCRRHRPAPRCDRRGRNVPGELHVPPEAAGRSAIRGIFSQDLVAAQQPPYAAYVETRRLRHLLGLARVVLRTRRPADRLAAHERHDRPRPLVRRRPCPAPASWPHRRRTGPRTP